MVRKPTPRSAPKPAAARPRPYRAGGDGSQRDPYAFAAGLEAKLDKLLAGHAAQQRQIDQLSQMQAFEVIVTNGLQDMSTGLRQMSANLLPLADLSRRPPPLPCDEQERVDRLRRSLARADLSRLTSLPVPYTTIPPIGTEPLDQEGSYAS